MARQLVVFDHEGAFQAAHAEMHLEGSAHHHGEHGVAHQDDSQESIQHMLAEAGPGARSTFPLPPAVASSRPLAHTGRDRRIRQPVPSSGRFTTTSPTDFLIHP